MLHTVPPTVAKIDASDERDITLGLRRTPQHNQLLVV
jgi:hypothetical protein